MPADDGASLYSTFTHLDDVFCTTRVPVLTKVNGRACVKMYGDISPAAAKACFILVRSVLRLEKWLEMEQNISQLLRRLGRYLNGGRVIVTALVSRIEAAPCSASPDRCPTLKSWSGLQPITRRSNILERHTECYTGYL